jgi:hypothetical protein
VVAPNLDRLNRWLSLSANLAVVAGIIFVAVELRQNNEMAEHARLELLGLRLLMVFEDSYLANLEGNGDLEQLRRVQRSIFHRPVLNFGGPLAWETFKARGDDRFLQWFEANVIAE